MKTTIPAEYTILTLNKGSRSKISLKVWKALIYTLWIGPGFSLYQFVGSLMDAQQTEDLNLTRL